MFKKIKNRKGFTLIELIVVIAILVVLAAIIIPTVASSLDRANNARDLANARSLYAEASITVLTSETPVGGTVTGPRLSCDYTVEGNSIDTFTCTLDGEENAIGIQEDGSIDFN